jgi:predicted enzyme related to lactoylglutathione lyase
MKAPEEGSVPDSAVRRGNMARVTGIGGVFFKAKTDDRALREWYKKHLGIKLEGWGGCALRWTEDKAEDKGVTAWHVAGPTTKWFSPSESSFMINYRIDNMDEMIAQLRAGGVSVHQGPEYHENGAFIWIIDPDGNKVELWEPKIWDERNKKS